MNIQFDPSINTSWGVYRCRCGAEYRPRGIPNHVEGCPGNGSVTYFFGIREVDSVLQESSPTNRPGDLTRNLLEKRFDELPPEVQERMRSLMER
jgi:hypothetical protein